MSTDETAAAPERLNAAQIRALTSRASKSRSDKSLTDVVGDFYTSIFTAIIAVTMMGGAVTGIEKSAGSPSSGGLLRTVSPVTPVPIFWASVLMLLVGVAITLGLLARLGPMSSSGDQATWWLSLPVERRGFMTPGLTRLLSVLFATGLAGSLLAVLGSGTGSPIGMVSGALGGMALGGIAIGMQVLGLRSLLVIVADIAAIAAPIVLAAYFFVGGIPASGLGTAGLAVPALWPLAAGTDEWIAAGLSAVFAAATIWLGIAAAGRFRVRELVAAGGVSSRVASSITTLDTRELSRVLAGPVKRRARRNSKFRWVGSPAAALLASEITLFVRSPRRIGQLVVLAVVPTLATVIQGVLSSMAVVFLAFLVCAFSAALTTVESSRQAEINPSLDRLLPMEARTVYRIRSVLPLILLTLWMAATCIMLGIVSGMGVQLVLLGVLTVPGFAGAGLRSAYRPAPDWSSPSISGPTGPIPTAAISALRRGPDFALFSSLTFGVGLFLGFVPNWLFAVDFGIALGLWALVVRRPMPHKKSLMERMQESQERLSEQQARR
ncbi:DUF6297 family protein [Spelaeicoccus albus]|uniref:ABC-2 type transport system permease protein n=1 Tax=Spelaeicoccus albus TaxID=1280376 RepID=A0A7Z0D2N3_9MICO|nr:DUF6297 family protein [Spelaeicoccus albus]NYI67726.1 hypothetical protein [Spelaeicoccus albus]